MAAKKPVTFIAAIGHVETQDPRAEFPYKARTSDIGYDVTLIARQDGITEDTEMRVTYFHTGIKITPPEGYYFEMMARSSLHKQGYILATGTSIIDPNYTGELLVPLLKFTAGEDLQLPCRAVQLVLKPAVYAHLSKISKLQMTDRSDMGFGSSGGYSSRDPATSSRDPPPRSHFY
jgi:dUTP pyrophosphatase